MNEVRLPALGASKLVGMTSPVGPCLDGTEYVPTSRTLPGVTSADGDLSFPSEHRLMPKAREALLMSGAWYFPRPDSNFFSVHDEPFLQSAWGRPGLLHGLGAPWRHSPGLFISVFSKIPDAVTGPG